MQLCLRTIKQIMQTVPINLADKQLQIAKQMLAESKAVLASNSGRKATKAERAIAIAMDTQLRVLQKLMAQIATEQARQLEVEYATPTSLLADFEIEGELNYLLAESDPAWDDDSETNNILATRDAWISTGAETLETLASAANTGSYGGSSKLLPQQCWLMHDLLDHSYKPGDPELSDENLLRVDKVWVNVKTTRQYCLNLRTGEFEKW